MTQFETLLKTGHPLPFFGVDDYKFKLGPYVFEAVEDRSDGYRSMMEEVKEVGEVSTSIFFKQPVDDVWVREADEYPNVDGFYGAFDGYELVGHDDHVWLRFGTSNSSDYYPCFEFHYTPKEPGR